MRLPKRRSVSRRALTALATVSLVVLLPIIGAAATGAATTGLVAAYAFDEGSGTTVGDASGNGNNGTVANTTWVTGKYGSALSFNGTSSRVNVPNSASLQLTSGMTLEAWVNRTSAASQWRDLIYKGDDNYYLSASSCCSGRPAGGGIIGGSYGEAFGTANLATGTWAFVTLTYDGTAVRLFVNGTQVASTAKTGAIATSTNPLQIGSDSIYGQYFNGLIDQVRIYNVALTQAQIATDMTTPITTNQDSTPPSAPGTLTATAVSDGRIDLAWGAATDNVAVTGYRVERCQGGSCTTFAQIAAPAGTGVTYSDLTVNASTSYSYRVRATDAAGNLGGYSNTASATTPDTTPPTAPGTLTASAVSTGRIDLAWGASTDNVAVAGYQIDRCQGASCTIFAQLAAPAGTGTSYSDLTVSASNTYSYRVRATDAAGNLGSYSNISSATTPAAADTTPPSTPGTLTATAISAGRIDLSWVAATDNVAVTGYQIERCQGSSCNAFAQIAAPTGTGTTYSDISVVASTTYSYRVRATDAAGNLGAYSNTGTATTPAAIDTTPPSAPGTLTASAISAARIDLSWGAATDNVAVTGYRIERCLGASCTTFAEIAAPAGTGTTYSDVTVNASTSYSYRVRATDAAGNLGGYSNTASTTTPAAPDTTPPSAPGTLTASAFSAGRIDLGWSAATDNVAVTGYRIERCQGASCTTFAQIAAPAGTGVTYSDTTVTASTTYSYRVRATDAAGNLGNYSNTATATTPSGSGNLVAAYGFDEGSGTTVGDASGNGNNGTVANTTWVTGKYGSALSFNGTSSRVNVPNSASLQLNSGMTLEAWVNPTTASNQWRDLIYKGDDNYYLSPSSCCSGRPAGGAIIGGSYGEAYGTANLANATWNFLTLTYDGTAVRLFLNGTQVASTAKSGAIATSTNPLQIGSDSIYGQYFNGLIDQVRIYNVALTQAQIQTDMTTPITSNQDTIPPGAPGTLTATALSGTRVDLSWGAASDNIGVTGYQIERCQGTSCSTFAQIAAPTGTGTTYSDLSVTASNAYSYRVRATDAAGNLGAYSNTATASTALIQPRVAELTFSGTQQFTSVSSVTWSVDGVVGGSTATGTITGAGLYSPPQSVGTHTVTATTLDGTQSASATVYVTNYAGTFTYHNNNSRTGVDATETVLTPANVNSTTFGKLTSYNLDGIAYASPLYEANVSVPGQGFHNVVYVATEHDTVYAFDADGRSNTPLWQKSFIDPANGITTVPYTDATPETDLVPEFGITATPVIDPATNTMYVAVKTKEIVGGAAQYFWRLHALDLATGAEKFGGPVTIQATVTGTGVGSTGSQLPFNALLENERGALLLQNGVVYLSFGSHGDAEPYHGWVFGYDASTLQQTMVWCDTPNNEGGGIWSSGNGLASDSTGDIFLATGDGTFTADTGGADFGDSLIRLTPGGIVSDYFTPHDQSTMDANDLDVSAGGVLLFPDQPGAHPHLMVAAGKNGSLYLADRDNLGHFNSANDNQIVQALPSVFSNGTQPEPGNYSTPVFFNGVLFYGAVKDTIKGFRLSNGLLTTTPVAKSALTYGYPGATLAISANGSSNGILWAIQRTGGASAAVLHAYDAANFNGTTLTELYNSSQAGTRDTLDIASKFSVPTVANGKVYVSSASQLTIYGLLP